MQWLCCLLQTFRAAYQRLLTFTVLEFDIEPDAQGQLSLYDDDEVNENRLIANYPIINNTMPQGITTTTRYLTIHFTWATLPAKCPILYDCIKFTILVDSGPGLCSLLQHLSYFLSYVLY